MRGAGEGSRATRIASRRPLYSGRHACRPVGFDMGPLAPSPGAHSSTPDDLRRAGIWCNSGATLSLCRQLIPA